MDYQVNTLDEFDKALAGASEQGSRRWFDIRTGRFTSSEFHKLIQPGERLMTDEELKNRPKSGPGSKSKWTEDPSKLSTGGETYIYQKVAEVLTGQPKNEVFSYATAHGDEWEPVAAEFYEKKFGVKTEPISFVPFGDHFGGSPDRLVGDELLEIKCPYDSANQVKYLELTDVFDLKRLHPDYYWQIQCNLLWTKKSVCNFVTFDPRMTDDKHKMAHLRIEADPTASKIIVERGAVAVKMKLEILKSLK